MILNLLGTGAVILLLVLGAHADWPDPKDGWTRVVGALVILAAIWF